MSSSTPPETSHRIAIAGAEVTYQLRRSQRRTIGLSIDHRGLRVGAPSRARIGDIERLIHEHGQWVLDKLANWRERPAPARLQITDGTVIFALGEPLTVAFTAIGRARWQFGPAGTLYVRVRPGDDANTLLEAALRDKARAVFNERLAIHAPRLGVAPPPLRLSSARTRWGSCSRHGGIRINWRLIHLPTHLGDYVVAHEVAHLLEMNHSKRFWAVVGSIYPNWKTARVELKQRTTSLPIL